jgi:hypothetical protein
MGEKQEDKAPDSQCTEEPYLSPGKAKPNVASIPLRKKGQPFAEGCPFALIGLRHFIRIDLMRQR